MTTKCTSPELHVDLHASFDELLACFLQHQPDKRSSNTTCMELFQWSAEQIADRPKHGGYRR